MNNNSISSAKKLDINKEYIDSAILEGINNNAITGYFEQLVENPTVNKDSFISYVSNIVTMKSSVEAVNNNYYSSNYFKNNGNKFYSALSDGITSQEVISHLQKTSDKDMGSLLEFITSIKSVEKSISLSSMEKEKSFQKVYSKQD